MRPVRIGAQLAPQRVVRRDPPGRRRGRDPGADILTWDHFFPLGKVAEGKHFEGWTIPAAWAEQTSRIDLGVLAATATATRPAGGHGQDRRPHQRWAGRVRIGPLQGTRVPRYGYEFLARPPVAELPTLPRIGKRPPR